MSELKKTNETFTIKTENLGEFTSWAYNFERLTNLKLLAFYLLPSAFECRLSDI